MICFKCFNSDKVIASNSLIKIAISSNFFNENINDFLDAGCSCDYGAISAFCTSTKR